MPSLFKMSCGFKLNSSAKQILYSCKQPTFYGSAPGSQLLYLHVITDQWADLQSAFCFWFFFYYMKVTAEEDFPEMYLFIHYCWLNSHCSYTLGRKPRHTNMTHTHFTACVISYSGKENSKLCLLFIVPVIPHLGRCEWFLYSFFFFWIS